MSEFKYACPVCGQHIRCDSSQAGTVMECPTCFQKITVPQAPSSEEQKFILTGTKAGERKPGTSAEMAARQTPPARTFPVGAVSFLVLLALAAGAAYFFFGGRISMWLAHWENADVGAVGLAGTFERKGQAWKVTGAGWDIWGDSDAFHYVYRLAKSDVALTTRVLTQENTDPWAKAGLMIRDSLAPDSAYAAVLVTPACGVAFQQRTHPGGQATSVLIVSDVHVPCSLRLARKGDVFNAEYSSDGKTWTALGSTTIDMQSEACAGLAVTSHNNRLTCLANFEQVNVVGGDKSALIVAVEPAAPPADDSHWSLAPISRPIPDGPVVGRIHGRDFIVRGAELENGTLMLRGTRHNSDFAALVDFSGATPDQLAGKTINVTTNADKAARITLHWKDDNGEVQKPGFGAGYSLRLQFGAWQDGRLPGKIYLSLPDPQKSYLEGAFEAEAPKPQPH